MARGDVTVFEEAKAYMLDGGWLPANDIKIAILDDTLTPVASASNPRLSLYTQVGTAGSYANSGVSLGNIATLVTEASGTMTFDSATNPQWLQNGSNDTDAHWGLIYNENDTTGPDRAIAFVDLGGPVDMTAGDLTITWNASGIFTIT